MERDVRHARVPILGVYMSAINMAQALQEIEEWIKRLESNYVCVTPAHAIMDYRRDPDLLRKVNQSGLTTPDGMSIVWLLRFMGHKHIERVYGPKLMLETCRLSVEKGWRHFLYGGEPGVAQSLQERLQERFPNIIIAGTYTPPFRPLTPEEDADVIARIYESHADLVWVGLGTPKQERWMADHLGRINAPVMVGVGAAFDFLSGSKPQAPRWIQRSGLEWLFRLASEPKRLWPRYRQYPLFVWLVLLQLLGLKEFPIE